MARTRTLTDLLADVRYLADIEGQTARHTDAQLTRRLNQAIAAYRRKFRQLYVVSSSVNTVAGTATLALPATLDSLERVAITVNGSTWVIYPATSYERHDYDLGQPSPSDGVPAQYRLEGSSLYLMPTPGGVYAMTLTYLPQQTDLASGGDTFDPVVSGGEDWVVASAALDVATRDQSPRAAMVGGQLQKAERQLADSLPRNAGTMRRVDTRARRAFAEAWGRYGWTR